MVTSIIALAIPLLSSSPVHAALTPHAPILIDGNAGFTIPDPVNGGGSGTENDPYTIENWVISAENAHGIEIRNTTAHFVVRNCAVENGGGGYCGIYLSWVMDGRIQSNICGNNSNGIYLYHSSNNTLDNNTCGKNDKCGICFYWYSDNNTLSNNTCKNNSNPGAIYLGHSSNNIITNNTCENNNECGIWLDFSSNNILDYNTCEKNDEYGICLAYSSNNTLSNNACGKNYYQSIWLYGSSNNILSNNIVENVYGLFSVGIYLDSSSDNNTLNNNTCENNRYGIYLWNSDNNQIYHNNFLNNSFMQARDVGTNYWDDGYPSGGNYWSDYTGVDENRGENQDIPGSDGIGDTPYPISGGANQDRYPLMNPWIPPPPAPPVGGIVTPVNKLALLAPWIVLGALIAIVTVSVAVYWRKR